MSLCCGGRYDCGFVIQMLEQHGSVRTVAAMLECGERVVYRIQRNWRLHGLLTSSHYPMHWVLKQSQLDHPFVAELIIHQMIIKPSSTLEEYVELIQEHTALRPSPATVHRFFKRRGITWKVLFRLAIEAIDAEVDEFYETVHTLVTNGEQLIFIDESNFYQLTNNRCVAFISFMLGKLFVLCTV